MFLKGFGPDQCEEDATEGSNPCEKDATEGSNPIKYSTFTM